tara:strand:- start:3076 stop:3936 length:861 start_codon:yes stop_codon:yes gene_type:complete
MKILILGATGMVGYNLYKCLKNYNDIFLSIRRKSIINENIFSEAEKVFFFDAYEILELANQLDDIRPNVIINAIGVTKQISKIDIANSIYINSLFPHNLYKICQEKGIRLIAFSTDCIFSGKKGFYSETDFADAQDLYGKTKFLGELYSEGSITIRKSTIGLELQNKHGLIEWWLGQKGQIKGYNNAIYSGIITAELGNVVNKIIHDFPELSGVWNISSDPISKYDLLSMLHKKLNRKDVTMIRDNSFTCDRSLDSTAFKNLTKYKAPTWNEMLDTLAHEIERKQN